MTRPKILRKRDKILDRLYQIHESALLSGRLYFLNDDTGEPTYLTFVKDLESKDVDRDLINAIFFRLKGIITVTWSMDNKKEKIKDMDPDEAVIMLISDMMNMLARDTAARRAIREDYVNYRNEMLNELQKVEQEASSEGIPITSEQAAESANEKGSQ